MSYTIYKTSSTGLTLALLNQTYKEKGAAIAALDEIERCYAPTCQSHWRASDGLSYEVTQDNSKITYHIKGA